MHKYSYWETEKNDKYPQVGAQRKKGNIEILRDRQILKDRQINTERQRAGEKILKKITKIEREREREREILSVCRKENDY